MGKKYSSAKPDEEGDFGEIDSGEEEATPRVNAGDDVVRRSKMTRRGFLAALGAGMATLLVPKAIQECNIMNRPERDHEGEEVEISEERMIRFMGEEVTVRQENQKKWAKSLDDLRGSLYLRFSKRRDVGKDEKHPHGEERNDEFWARAIEDDFYGALLRADDYQPIVEEAAEAYGVPEDMLAVFFIESGLASNFESRTGYYGIPQMGLDEVQKCRKFIEKDRKKKQELGIELGPSPAIPDEEWRSYLEDPWYAIHNGAVYLRWLRTRIPENNSIKTYLQERWPTSLLTRQGDPEETLPEEIEELERIETVLGITRDERENAADLLSVPMEDRPAEITEGQELRWRMQYVVERLFEDFEGNDLTFQDPWGMTVASYNFGAANLARMVFKNLLAAKERALADPKNSDRRSRFATSERNSVGEGSGVQSVATIDFDMSLPLKTGDNEATCKERTHYYPMALLASRMLDQWFALNPGENLKVPFKSSRVLPVTGETETFPHTYSLVKSAE